MLSYITITAEKTENHSGKTIETQNTCNLIQRNATRYPISILEVWKSSQKDESQFYILSYPCICGKNKQYITLKLQLETKTAQLYSKPTLKTL